ncbi:MAG: acetyl-CoA carboxylase, biotin carboxyl carrier protein [Acidobacteria bacterium RIFCSPLOWO2_02_FULL_65_29]|nr:MAG: acetyl-CoA carboxylase, biotin carboxyl carrier protein [Acidobacteria bacterium RIFCSPLOWO2_02_FULL_65_29]
MDLDHLRQILALVQEHELSEFEIEQDGLRLFVRKHGVAHHAPAAASLPAAVPAALLPPGGAVAPVAAASAVEAADTEIELAIVKSPIVGTFYRSPEPGAPAFVEVGSAVKKRQVLCIIEAMKLMNEIDSEYDGEVVNIYVESGQPVQYGERLFAIRAK